MNNFVNNDFSNDEKIIFDTLSELKVDTSRLMRRVINKMNEKNTVRMGVRRLKPIAVVVILIVSLLITATVLAAVLGGFEWFVNRLNPRFGEVIVPVEIYAVDNDIRIEVIGAQTFGNQVIAYISVRDISGQNRITENAGFSPLIDLLIHEVDETLGAFENDSYGFVSGGGSGFAQMIHFDEATNTAFFEIISWQDTTSVADRLRVFTDIFTLDSTLYFNIPLALELSALAYEENRPETEIFRVLIWDMEAREDRFELREPTLIELLAPGGHFAYLPHNRAEQWISGVGIIDGQLHIQVAEPVSARELHFPWFTLLCNATGNEAFPARQTSFNTDRYHEFIDFWSEGEWLANYYRYANFIFDIDMNNLANYSIIFTGGYFTTIEGNWEIIFDINYTGAQMHTWAVDVDIAGRTLENVTLTPAGMQARGHRSQSRESYPLWEFTPLLLTLETTEGYIDLGAGWENAMFYPSFGEFQLIWVPWDETIDVPSVIAVIIDGVRIEVE